MSNKYQILFNKKFLKDLKYIEKIYQKPISEAVRDLANDPRPYGYIKLKGYTDLYRIRVGDYRIIYTIQDHKLIVLVLEIGDRKDIYKKH